MLQEHKDKHNQLHGTEPLAISSYLAVQEMINMSKNVS
jgi:hypothetical protein